MNNFKYTLKQLQSDGYDLSRRIKLYQGSAKDDYHFYRKIANKHNKNYYYCFKI